MVTLNDINMAIKKLEGHYRVDIDDIKNKAVRNIAKADTSTPSTLDAGDFFALLSCDEAICVPDENAKCRMVLRSVLDFPKTDMNGIKLSFTSVPTLSGNNVAVTKIVPSNVDKTKSPMVFVGGLYHKTAIYLNFLEKLAKSDRREIISMDLPGIGASLMPKGKSIDHSLFYEALISVIKSQTKEYDHIIIMGHSLGTVPVRHLYFNQGDISQKVDKIIMVAPIPSVAEERAGLRILPYYLSSSAVTLLDGVMNPVYSNIFFNAHSKSEAVALEKEVGKERLPVSVPNFVSTLYRVDKESILDRIGHDPKLVWILPAKDELIRLENPKKWKSKGLIIVDGADHSFMAGNASTKESIDAVKSAMDDDYGLDGVWSGKKPLDKGSIFCSENFRFNVIMEAGGGQMGGFGYFGADEALLGRFSEMVAIKTGLRMLVGVKSKGKVFSAPVMAYLEFLITPKDDRGYISPGVEFGYDFLEQNFTSIFGYFGWGYNLFNVANLGIQFGMYSDKRIGARLMIKFPIF